MRASSWLTRWTGRSEMAGGATASAKYTRHDSRRPVRSRDAQAARRLRFASDHFLRSQRRDLVLAVPELSQHLFRMLAKERRACDVGGAVGQFDRIADRQILAALGVIDLHHGAGCAQRRL